MKISRTLCLLGLVIGAPAFADCTPPEGNVAIPNGNEATRDEMIATQKAVKTFDAAVKTYSECLQQEQEAKIAAGGDKQKLAKQYSELNNAWVDKVQQVADKFNVELRAFKAKSGG